MNPATTSTWSWPARHDRGRRLRPPESIAGTGEDELAALTDLVLRLREYGKPDNMAALERRARQAYFTGAEDHTRAALGRGLTDEELGRVVGRYPERERD